MSPPSPAARAPRLPAFILGLGLGGFLDGIVLHQVLQWHHMLTSTGDQPSTTVAGLEANTLADGIFHMGTWVLVLLATVLAIRAWQRGEIAPPWRAHVGMVLAGWGVFNLVEGLINHQLLGIHHVRDDLGAPLGWDLAFLGLGAALVAGGLLLERSARTGPAAARPEGPADRFARTPPRVGVGNPPTIGEHMSSVEQSIELDVPVRVAYDQWTQFAEFPQFMEGVQEVWQVDDTHTHWHTRVAGKDVEFDAEITEQHPDERIAWRSTSGPAHAGVVTFHRLSDERTKIMLQVDAEPEGMVEKVGDALGALNRRTKGDLERFRELVERRGVTSGGWRGDVAAG